MARTLSDEDIELIRSQLACERCQFTGEQMLTLQSIADQTNRATRLATKTIVTGMVLGFMAVVWTAIKHLVLEFVKNGGIK